MATSLEFKIPSDPHPMPTMGSDDEESFVVLGKSLVPDLDLSFKDLNVEPIPSGPIEEGKKLINMELNKLENSYMPSTSEENHGDGLTMNIVSSELSPEEVQQKVDSLIAENIKLRETIMSHNAIMESQHERIIAWKEEVQKTHQAHKQKFSEAKLFIAGLKHDKEFLTQELEKCREIKEMQQIELFKLKDELKQKETSDLAIGVQKSLTIGNEIDEKNKELEVAKSRIEELKNLLQHVNSSKEELAKENKEIQASAMSAQKLINQLSNEIQEKNTKIEELNGEIRNKDDSMTQIVKNLSTEVINLRSQLCLTVNFQEDLTNVRKQLMSSQTAITDFQQANAVLAAQLRTEQEKVKELKKYEAMRDDYLALEQQVNIYKADFEAERQTKEELKAEKDQMMRDFLQIQKRNNELNEEIELIKERGFEVIGSRRSPIPQTSGAGARNTSPPQGSPPLNQYECPICNLKYRSLRFLEQHVETCIPEPSWL